MAALAGVGNQIDRQLGLPVDVPVTLDLDSTATEVYGLQELADFNYLGQRSCRSLLVSWAQRRRMLACDLLSVTMMLGPWSLTWSISVIDPGRSPSGRGGSGRPESGKST